MQHRGSVRVCFLYLLQNKPVEPLYLTTNRVPHVVTRTSVDGYKYQLGMRSARTLSREDAPELTKCLHALVTLAPVFVLCVRSAVHRHTSRNRRSPRLISLSTQALGATFWTRPPQPQDARHLTHHAFLEAFRRQARILDLLRLMVHKA